MKYFNYCSGLTMTHPRLHRLFGGPPRKPESRLTQREMDLARSVQDVIEMAVINLARAARTATGSDSLCLAGGVALNCVANGKLLRENLFKKLWIQPAAGDAGGALGAALAVWHEYAGKPRTADGIRDGQKGSLLGPSFTDREIGEFLSAKEIPNETLDETALIGTAAKLLADGKVVGWFEGRMEFGPRALGARSILGDPRNAAMQKMMNLKIKFRESFRPFAPAVIDSEAARYFEIDRPSPYMLLVADVRKELRNPVPAEHERLWGIELLNEVRSAIPAVTHVDYSARIQTVHHDTNPKFYALLTEFKRITGCPVLVNTSFNVRGEPLVCGPEDAYLCFMRTEMDALVIGSRLLLKADQPAFKGDEDWREKFQLD
jgi:carbamoyltransferase